MLAAVSTQSDPIKLGEKKREE